MAPRLANSPTQDLARRYAEDLPLEHVACYLCGSEGGKLLVDDPPFQVLSCRSCGLAYTTPRLDGSRIHELYSDHYFNSESAEGFGYSGYVADTDGYLRTFAKKARLIERFESKGRLLEIGCAAGVFLEVMRRRGFEVHGSEIAEETLRSARENFGLENLHHGPLHALDLPGSHFDVVAAFDVIEHVAEPLEMLEQMKAFLRPGGLLVLQTQDVSSMTRKVLGAKWHHFKQLEHIYHFSPRTLRSMLERTGYEIVEVRRRGAGKYVSLDFVRERLHRRIGLPGWSVAPLKLFGGRFVYVNPFDEMLAFARKRKD